MCTTDQLSASCALCRAPSRPIGGEYISAARRSLLRLRRSRETPIRITSASSTRNRVFARVIRQVSRFAVYAPHRPRADLQGENSGRRRRTGKNADREKKHTDVRDARSCVTSAGFRTFRLPRATV